MMKFASSALVLSTILLFGSIAHAETSSTSIKKAATGTDEWTYLFDKDMSGWTTYLGFPRPETPIKGSSEFNLPKNSFL